MNQQTFVQRVRSILSDNEGRRWHPAQRCGVALDEPRLALVPAGFRRVFRRPAERKFKDYHVFLAVDVSGSMHGAEMQHAAVACHSLHYAMSVAKVASVKVIGFARGTFDLTEVSRWDVQKLHYAMKRPPINTGTTWDFQALEEGVRWLRPKTGGKIVCLITDGGSSSQEKLLGLLDSARRDGIVVLALGIGSNMEYLTGLYGAQYARCVYDSEDLYAEMITMLERQYRRG